MGTFFQGTYPSVTGSSSVVYALGNHMTSKKYQTEANVTTPYWQSSLTSAFTVEVEKPAAAIKTIATAYKLTPAIVGSNVDLLTLLSMS